MLLFFKNLKHLFFDSLLTEKNDFIFTEIPQLA